MWMQVKRYSGDGVIRTCSTVLVPGYLIEFPKFDSTRPYEASYRLSHVPQKIVSGREYLYALSNPMSVWHWQDKAL